MAKKINSAYTIKYLYSGRVVFNCLMIIDEHKFNVYAYNGWDVCMNGTTSMPKSVLR